LWHSSKACEDQKNCAERGNAKSYFVCFELHSENMNMIGMVKKIIWPNCMDYDEGDARENEDKTSYGC
jgi:hypothetical protein